MHGDEAIPFLNAMLTQEMIFALLQGLPADHLDYLDRPWFLLAKRIERAMKEGQDPYTALHSALTNSHEWERQAYLRAFLQEEPVLALPDLTPRQKDALIALRYSGACSLQQLSRILALDRSYTRRLLEVLIEKGYAIKYFRRDGPYYLAISSPMSDQARSQVTELMQAFKQALFEAQDKNPVEDSESPRSHKSRLSPKSPESRVSPESHMSSQSRESRPTHPTRSPRPP